MKKLLTALTACLLGVSLTGCSQGTAASATASSASSAASAPEVLKVSATLEPHATILEYAKGILLSDYNIDLEITVLDDYYIFNKSLNDGEVDANFFQHQPFFENDCKENGYDLVNVGGVHIEPFGFYSKTITSVDDLADGATIIISNSVADHGRILSILQDAGLIKLDENVDAINATIEKIKENPKNLKFEEVKPELLTTVFENGEGDLVAINGNYAIQAGLNPTKDAVILESADENNPYVNIVACQAGHENDAKIQALITVLQSDDVKNFIRETWADGSVIPVE